MLKGISAIKKYRWHAKYGVAAQVKDKEYLRIGCALSSSIVKNVVRIKNPKTALTIRYRRILNPILGKIASVNSLGCDLLLFVGLFGFPTFRRRSSPNFINNNGITKYRKPSPTKNICLGVNIPSPDRIRAICVIRSMITTGGKIAETAMRFLICVQNVLLNSFICPVSSNIKYSIKLRTNEDIAHNCASSCCTNVWGA